MPEAIKQTLSYENIKLFLAIAAIAIPMGAAWVEAREDIRELQSRVQTVESVPERLQELNITTARLDERVKSLIEKIDKLSD